MLSSGFKLIVAAIAASFLMVYGVAGCTHIAPGEVGILMKNLGSDTGMQKEVLTMGTHWVDPTLYDVTIYDTRLQQYQLEDTDASSQDGQPIQVDVSLEIGLDDAQVPFLHSKVGRNWFEQIVKPSAISALRQATASIVSDSVYTGVGRVNIEKAAEQVLKEKYEAFGIRLNFNVRDVQFQNKAFVQTLEKKAAASQQEIIETRLALAAIQEAVKISNTAEGAKQKKIKEAEASMEESRLQGQGLRLRKEEEAKGIFAIAKAEADGTRLRREALSGAGGSELVSIEWAKNLGPNVKVYAVPTGAPGTTSLMDLNGIMQGALTGAHK